MEVTVLLIAIPGNETGQPCPTTNIGNSLFVVSFFIDIQDASSYTSFRQKQYLINLNPEEQI
jgi:hypothetical protein